MRDIREVLEALRPHQQTLGHLMLLMHLTMFLPPRDEPHAMSTTNHLIQTADWMTKNKSSIKSLGNLPRHPLEPWTYHAISTPPGVRNAGKAISFEVSLALHV